MTKRERLLRKWGPGLVLSGLALLAGLYFRYELVAWFTAANQPVHIVDSPNAPPDPGAPSDVAYYTCSMHPSVRSDTPGTCPICAMDLTPVSREEIETGTILVDARRRQLIGVKTGVARRQTLVQTIQTVGQVRYDETRLADVSLKFRGWIGEIFADYTGKFVEAGTPLFTIYSPELLSAQDEYLESLHQSRHNPERGSALLEAARSRLLLWDLKQPQLEALTERNRPAEYVPILSPLSGTIIVKNAVKGSAVSPGQLLYRIADLSAVWIEAQIYEYEVPLAKVGQTAEISLSYLPDRRFRAKVSYIYPYLDAGSRTARIRIEAPNPHGALKPEMYANVEIQVPLGERLVVPEESVLYAGETRLVFLDRGDGRVEPRKITTGLRNRDLVEVLDGLEEGDVVVTSANFLIAAESKIKAGVGKW